MSTLDRSTTMIPTLVFIVTSILHAHAQGHVCQFPAIFNFGDSNSDTGSVSAAFGRVPPPYGQTFFAHPSGRYSDGRLIIDFLAEKLDLPYLGAFLDSLGTNFRHGANFAASGSTIETATGLLIDSGFNPFSLKIQLSQFQQFKNRTIELYRKSQKFDLPRPEDFSKALYTIDIGQNDLHFKLITATLEQVFDYIPNLINQTSLAIEKLYEEGARSFWIHNTGPLGCLPFFLVNYPVHPNNTDEIGCVKSHNEVAQKFNRQLRDLVYQLRDKHRDSAFTYVDVYRVKYGLFKDASNNRFVDRHGFCCKHPDEASLRCWDVKTVNGSSVYATSCRNPGEYISWDSIHFTEAANHWVVDRICDGSLSHPPHPITQACHQTAFRQADHLS